MKTVFPDIAAYPSLLEILEDAARRRPGEVAMALAADEGMLHAWSAPEVLRRSRLAAWRLYALGMRPGDRLLTWCPSGPELAALTFGAIRLGVAIVPLDLRMAAEVIERIAAHADTAWMAIGAGRDAPDVRDVQLPDVVMRTVPALVAEAGAGGGPPRQPRLVSLLPLSHLFGQLELGYALIAGAPILYIRSRNPRVIFEAIREHHVTTMVVVPQVLDLFWSAIEREVAKQGREASFARLRSIARRLPYALRRRIFPRIPERLGGRLELFVCSAAFLPPALQQAWEDVGVVVLQGFGATECGFATANRVNEHPQGVVGKPVPHVEVRLDPESSEVVVRGENVFRGYWRDVEATAATLDAEGWYHTGDTGHWNERDQLVLSGRIKNMIVLPNGLNVYPEDIENVLREAGLRDTVVLETAPGRIEAVVLPPDEPLMPRPGAAPEPRARTPEEAAAMRARIDAAVKAANARLGIHQRVEGWRLWPEPDFPRTHTLKIKRGLVRAWLASDVPLPVRDEVEAAPDA